MERKKQMSSIKKENTKTSNPVARKKYLPIGTVVRLKSAKKRLFITGFCVTGNSNKNKIWDYSGYIYPEGNIRTDILCMFDHSQIEKIYHLGYENEEEKVFKHQLKEYKKRNKA